MASSSKSEQSYVQSSLLAVPPLRADGRTLLDYRPIALETGVAPLANGSSRVCIGGGPNGAGSALPGTEVIAAVKLEVEEVDKEGGVEQGRIMCTVSCSASAYPNLNNNALDDLQSDLSSILHQTLAHPSLHPSNLSILPGRKSWLLHVDVLVLADGGNIYDALFLAATAALRDTRVPRTRGIAYEPRRGGPTRDKQIGEDVSMDNTVHSGFNTEAIKRTTDFELSDYWDEGEPLGNGESWPVCITLNLLHSIHYLDATPLEESATPLRLLLFFSFPDPELTVSSASKSNLQGMRLLGHGEADSQLLKSLIRQGQEYARKLKCALTTKLRSEASRRNPKEKKR